MPTVVTSYGYFHKYVSWQKQDGEWHAVGSGYRSRVTATSESPINSLYINGYKDRSTTDDTETATEGATTNAEQVSSSAVNKTWYQVPFFVFEDNRTRVNNAYLTIKIASIQKNTHTTKHIYVKQLTKDPALITNPVNYVLESNKIQLNSSSISKAGTYTIDITALYNQILSNGDTYGAKAIILMPESPNEKIITKTLVKVSEGGIDFNGDVSPWITGRRAFDGKIMINGTYKEIDNVFLYNNNSWHEVESIHVYNQGEWKN